MYQNSSPGWWVKRYVPASWVRVTRTDPFVAVRRGLATGKVAVVDGTAERLADAVDMVHTPFVLPRGAVAGGHYELHV